MQTNLRALTVACTLGAALALPGLTRAQDEPHAGTEYIGYTVRKAGYQPIHQVLRRGSIPPAITGRLTASPVQPILED